MKKYMVYIVSIIIVLGFGVFGCNNARMNEREENEMKKNYDFKMLESADTVGKMENADEIIKILFTLPADSGPDSLTHVLAIDVENKEVYYNENLNLIGWVDPTKTISDSEIQSIYDILERYEVNTWKEDYTFENTESYEDGTGWLLVIEWKSGAIERHGGVGSNWNQIVPENFEGVAEGFLGIVNIDKDK